MFTKDSKLKQVIFLLKECDDYVKDVEKNSSTEDELYECDHIREHIWDAINGLKIKLNLPLDEGKEDFSDFEYE